VWSERGIDLSNVLRAPDAPAGTPLRRTQAQESPLADALDHELAAAAHESVERAEPFAGTFALGNANRTVGGLLSHAVTKRHGRAGLPPGTIRLQLEGSAGQSFGAWL